MKPIIVFGSINMDLVTKTPRLPVAGETLQGHEFFTAAGGKGANQAVAAARLGVSTHIVGRLGDDDFGHQLLSSLQVAGVHTDGVLVDGAIGSGVAVIAVDDAGENNIITIAGANGRLGEADVERLKSLLPGAGALLMQLEIPMPVVLLAAQAANSSGIPVILDPAPAQNIPIELYPLVNVITPNRWEASQLVGFPVDDQEKAAKAAKVLRERGVSTAIIKLGAEGVLYAAESETFFLPAFSVEAVDTVAAGDAFNGALAAALVEGLTLPQAVVWGAAAGAISATKAGAEPSLPNRQTFDAFLKDRGI
ncbi:MAG: ribokinase [Symploca sp. SIO3C6]|uniref:Ribokinase n=1 Tax=Symploca sp. SIO1C4 TaxID=2607765 RepID=A0A6B3NAY7_9CYAN|nr:ribokinase [Symploca sp. SIO3C6]NER30269.1 ribokinase [Symploca sp. SIO1C4]